MTKKRNRLGTSTVEKLVLVQSSLKDLEIENQKIKMWKDTDLNFTVASRSIQQSFEKSAQEFRNFIEP